MARLFWVGVGAVGTVIAWQRVNRAARRYTPEAVAERVEAAGERASAALGDAVGVFHAARARRERELVDTLLVTPEGGDAGAVLGRRRPAAGRSADPADPAADVPRGARPTRPTGRVDEDEPLYDF